MHGKNRNSHIKMSEKIWLLYGDRWSIHYQGWFTNFNNIIPKESGLLFRRYLPHIHVYQWYSILNPLVKSLWHSLSTRSSVTTCSAEMNCLQQGPAIVHHFKLHSRGWYFSDHASWIYYILITNLISHYAFSSLQWNIPEWEYLVNLCLLLNLKKKFVL